MITCKQFYGDGNRIRSIKEINNLGKHSWESNLGWPRALIGYNSLCSGIRVLNYKTNNLSVFSSFGKTIFRITK